MFSVEKLKEKFNITGRILVNEPLSERTSMKVGGKAPLLFIPDKEEGFVRLLGILKTNDFQNYFRDFMSGEGLTPYQHGLYFILGGGTNIVVSDKGFSCPVVSTGDLCDFEILGNEDERFGCNSACDAAQSEDSWFDHREDDDCCGNTTVRQEHSAWHRDNGLQAVAIYQC